MQHITTAHRATRVRRQASGAPRALHLNRRTRSTRSRHDAALKSASAAGAYRTSMPPHRTATGPPSIRRTRQCCHPAPKPPDTLRRVGRHGWTPWRRLLVWQQVTAHSSPNQLLAWLIQKHEGARFNAGGLCIACLPLHCCCCATGHVRDLRMFQGNRVLFRARICLCTASQLLRRPLWG